MFCSTTVLQNSHYLDAMGSKWWRDGPVGGEYAIYVIDVIYVINEWCVKGFLEKHRVWNSSSSYPFERMSLGKWFASILNAEYLKESMLPCGQVNALAFGKSKATWPGYRAVSFTARFWTRFWNFCGRNSSFTDFCGRQLRCQRYCMNVNLDPPMALGPRACV